MKNPHFILYVADGKIFQAGPFAAASTAIAWAEQNQGVEFDIGKQAVYHQLPDGSLVELFARDIGA